MQSVVIAFVVNKLLQSVIYAITKAFVAYKERKKIEREATVNTENLTKANTEQERQDATDDIANNSF